MSGPLHRPVALAFGLLALFAGTAVQAADKPACKAASLGAGQVQSVLDGRTLQLADGREVRLAGIEAPQSAKAALKALLPGRDVALLRLGADSDRYGRVVARVSVAPAAPAAEPSVPRTRPAAG